MVEVRVFCRGDGWNFGAPQAKFSSNPDENFADLGVGKANEWRCSY
jgi:hypothetical protein